MPQAPQSEIHYEVFFKKYNKIFSNTPAINFTKEVKNICFDNFEKYIGVSQTSMELFFS